ncbi:P-loop containing nucleoside triphosphate hydrolase protein [Hypoxylon sp. FL0890]|nr:P-loop containing nucleoside triphosphate hydrolase protein [Hypoxylon sp. FL0890]
MGNASKSPPPMIIFVLGPPGAGKGTLCTSAAATKGIFPDGLCCRHLSVGDYLRHICKSESPCDRQIFDISKIRVHLEKYKLLPADVLIPVIEDWISRVWNNKSLPLLIDGFPRNLQQAVLFEEKIGKPVKVIILQCAHDTARARFLLRKREDGDDEKRFEMRYSEYLETMKAICERYKGIVESKQIEKSGEETVESGNTDIERQNDIVSQQIRSVMVTKQATRPNTFS